MESQSEHSFQQIPIGHIVSRLDDGNVVLGELTKLFQVFVFV